MLGSARLNVVFVMATLLAKSVYSKSSLLLSLMGVTAQLESSQFFRIQLPLAAAIIILGRQCVEEALASCINWTLENNGTVVSITFDAGWNHRR